MGWESIETCSGNYGEYLHINLPHKTSFYLSNQIPIVVWNRAYISNFIKDNNCGFGVDNLFELMLIEGGENKSLKESAAKQSGLIGSGYYLYSAIDKLALI